MSDFFKFITDNAENQEISSAFIKELNDQNDMEKLQAWFKNKGYDVTLQECQELIAKKKNIVKIGDTVKGY